MSDAASCRSAHRLGVSEGIRGQRKVTDRASASPQLRPPVPPTAPPRWLAQAQSSKRLARNKRLLSNRHAHHNRSLLSNKRLLRRWGYPWRSTNSIGMQLVLIPAGEFMMGSPATEDGRNIR